MKTSTNFPTINQDELIAHYENVISVCNKKLDRYAHPEKYGWCLSKCNSIVINKERMMTITTDENHMTTNEFSPLYPTYFSPETAKKIVKCDEWKDINDNRIKLEIVGEREYYELLKEDTELRLENTKRVLQLISC